MRNFALNSGPSRQRKPLSVDQESLLKYLSTKRGVRIGRATRRRAFDALAKAPSLSWLIQHIEFMFAEANMPENLFGKKSRLVGKSNATVMHHALQSAT